jgi:hypothetical protein
MAAHHSRKDFLDALFRDYYKEYPGFILIRTSARNDTKVGSRYFPNSDGVSREQYSEETNVFFGVCPRERMKPGKGNIQFTTCVWTGLDIGPDGYSGKEKHFVSERQAMMAIMAFPLKPSIIVHSGRGMHLYWLLKRVTEIVDPGGFERLLDKIGSYFQCPTPSGLDAVLRLPETWNSKSPVQSVECFVESLEPGLRYELEQFQNLDLRIIIPSKKAPRMPQVQLPSPVRISMVDLPESGQPQVALRDRISSGAPSVTPERAEHVTTDVVESSPENGTVTLDDKSMDKLVDRLMDLFSEKLLDRIADRVAQKVLQGLLNPGGIQ